MNKREARKRAHFHAALILEDAIANGWGPDQYSDEEQEKILTELEDLAATHMTRWEA